MVPKLRKFTHDDRLRIAHHIADRVVKKYGNNVLAVYVCGSTSKKLDRPFSDLELIVVVRDRAEISMKYYLHRGLIIQIEYLKSSKILSDAEQFTDNWPWEADQYRNRIVLYQRDRWFRRLDEAVAKNDKKNSVVAIRKSFMMMTESMAVLRNAALTNDKAGVLSRGRRMLAEDAARILLLSNRRYVTTTSWLWKIAFGIRNNPKDFKKLVEKMSGFIPTNEEVVVSSERLYKGMSELVTHYGVKIERDHLWV